MARFEMDNISEKKRVQIIGELYDALARIKNRKEARAVFRDLFTVPEIAMMSRRIQIAFMLLEGYTFEDTSNMLSVSSTTVHRIKEKLERHGEGFKIMYQNFRKIQDKRWKKHKPTRHLIPMSMAEAAKTAPMFTIMDVVTWLRRKKEEKEE